MKRGKKKIIIFINILNLRKEKKKKKIIFINILNLKKKKKKKKTQMFLVYQKVKILIFNIIIKILFIIYS